MVKDKDCAGFLQKISAEIDLLIAVEISGFTRSRSAKEIKKIAQNCGINAASAKNFDEAFEIVKAGEGALTLVCGSLYLAGTFIEENSLTTKSC